MRGVPIYWGCFGFGLSPAPIGARQISDQRVQVPAIGFPRSALTDRDKRRGRSGALSYDKMKLFYVLLLSMQIRVTVIIDSSNSVKNPSIPFLFFLGKYIQRYVSGSSEVTAVAVSASELRTIGVSVFATRIPTRRAQVHSQPSLRQMCRTGS